MVKNADCCNSEDTYTKHFTDTCNCSAEGSKGHLRHLLASVRIHTDTKKNKIFFFSFEAGSCTGPQADLELLIVHFNLLNAEIDYHKPSHLALCP